MDVNMYEVDDAVHYITQMNAGATPDTGIILGSGLGEYADQLEDRVKIPYRSIPGFPVSTAPGHKGMLYIGNRNAHRLAVMSGRFHYYEGYSMSQVTFPVRVMARMGIRRLIITNASGAINLDFPAGSLMLIRDHINLCGTNPLIGPNASEFGERFPDMTDVYNRELRAKLQSACRQEDIPLYEGVYVMMSGPSFETPAEIRFLRTIGGDAVGMSSVPEAIVAKHSGMDVIGISCLSNAAAGVLDQPLSGEEVLEASRKISGTFRKVLDLAVRI